MVLPNWGALFVGQGAATQSRIGFDVGDVCTLRILRPYIRSCLDLVVRALAVFDSSSRVFGAFVWAALACVIARGGESLNGENKMIRALMPESTHAATVRPVSFFNTHIPSAPTSTTAALRAERNNVQETNQ